MFDNHEYSFKQKDTGSIFQRKKLPRNVTITDTVMISVTKDITRKAAEWKEKKEKAF